MGHAADLAGVGSQRAVGSGPNAMLLVRGEDGAVRAFANTCRHRGHELLACGATAKRRGIVCRTTRGRTASTADCAMRPASRTSRASSPAEFGLAQLRLVDWHGWLFVDPSGEDAEFSQHVAGSDDVVGRYRPEDLTIVARHSYELATNWKVIAENYQECYHCSTIHPGAVPDQPTDQRREPRVPGLVDGRLDVDRRRRRDHVVDRRERRRRDPGASEHELHSVMYLVGYPNLLVSLHPDYVMTHLMTPLAVDRTHVECAWAFPKGVADKPDFDPSCGRFLGI